MHKSVELANDARRQFQDESADQRIGRVKVGLSLGPYGATLCPTQEFEGCYPPPYGPKAYDTARHAVNINTFETEADEARAVDALAEFHLERLKVYYEDQATWRGIDCIAFETVPLIREIKAVRKAMHMLLRPWVQGYPTNSRDFKPWWISTVWPSGRFPQTELNGASVKVAEVMRALLEAGANQAEPSGIGLNCTNIQNMPSILREATAAMNEISQRSDNSRKPWLVLYPNGGDVFDVATHRWTADPSGKGTRWAEDLMTAVLPYRGEWQGLVLGGCCRTGPKEISALSKRVREMNC